jgi:hypothetical protein
MRRRIIFERLKTEILNRLHMPPPNRQRITPRRKKPPRLPPVKIRRKLPPVTLLNKPHRHRALPSQWNFSHSSTDKQVSVQVPVHSKDFT